MARRNTDELAHLHIQVLLAMMLSGIYSLPTADSLLTPIASSSQQITADGTVKTLTPPSGAVLTVVQAEGQNWRWWDDTQTPTTTFGTQLFAGAKEYYNANPSSLKFREEVTTSPAGTAKLNVAYYAGIE